MIKSANIRDISLTKMKIFSEFVLNRTLTKTARSMGVTASLINSTILSIENVLGAKVYEKEKSNRDELFLTETGMQFLEIVNKFLNATNHIDTESDLLQKTPSISIGTTVWDAEYLMPRVIKKFESFFPDVTVELFAGLEFTDLTRSDIDVAFGHAMNDQTEIQQRFVKEFTFKFYATQEYLDKNGWPKTPEEFVKHKIFIHKHAPTLPDFIFRNNTIKLKANIYMPILEMALEGHGVAMLNEAALTTNEKTVSLLLSVLPNFEVHRFSMFFLNRKNSQKKEMVEVLFDILSKEACL